MNEDQIKHMVDRFLSWKLPENFNPDNGISFEPTFNNGTGTPAKRNPVGTNLLDATQAEAMIRHVVAGMPDAPGHTDLMVAPEDIDAFMEANPLPPEIAS